ncbi:MAG TPA: hypothetical protein VJ372_00975 [Pyrinomonadaceae bacterium]|nr:hypothetical protein [Pyrinomonadaceae bacterium]
MACSCAVILVGVVISKGDGETERFLTGPMLVLSFPLGVLARPLVILTGFLTQMISPLGSLVQINNYVMVWFWFFVLGYVQWFWLVPSVVRLIKRVFFGQLR